MTELTLSPEQCKQARLARDARFDGQFFVAVKTTGIFCRPICPAVAPKEKNVTYYANAARAAKDGYRPCLRCRPDSAPGSWAWRGAETTFQRAVSLIENGALQESNLVELSDRLGITDRYLRQLFDQHLGMSPKQYAQYQQLMFAKQLLHNSALPISEIALASGFQSIRRFNDAFKKHLQLTPSDVRKQALKNPSNQLTLAFRAPLNWPHLLAFYERRMANGIEVIEGEGYGRSFELSNARGWFKVTPRNETTLTLDFEIDNVTALKKLVNEVRRMLDLDADIHTIETHLSATPIAEKLEPGLRIPGVWSAWEAGVRAILGQQVSVTAAINQLNLLVEKTSRPINSSAGFERLFPTPNDVALADLSFLKMPNARKETLTRFAMFMSENPNAHPQQWLELKGIGPWTAQYAMLRGLSEPNHFLSGDLVIKKALATLPEFSHDELAPWGSYATFQLWNAS